MDGHLCPSHRSTSDTTLYSPHPHRESNSSQAPPVCITDQTNPSPPLAPGCYEEHNKNNCRKLFRGLSTLRSSSSNPIPKTLRFLDPNSPVSLFNPCVLRDREGRCCDSGFVRLLHRKRYFFLVAGFDGVRFVRQWNLFVVVLRLVLALGLESDAA